MRLQPLREVQDVDLKRDYAVEFKDKMDEYLGANVEGNEECAYVHIADYIDSMHEEFSGEIAKMDANPEYKCDIRVPASKHLNKILEDALFCEEDKTLSAEDTTLYRSVVGKLMHGMVKARVDIGLAVGLLARAQAKPTKALLHAALHVVKYLKATRRLGLKFDSKDFTVRGLFPAGSKLNSASDADWGVRHSTSGFISFLFGALVGWASKKQRSMALSSTEAEIFAASLAGVDHHRIVRPESFGDRAQKTVSGFGRLDPSRDRAGWGPRRWQIAVVRHPEGLGRLVQVCRRPRAQP